MEVMGEASHSISNWWQPNLSKAKQRATRIPEGAEFVLPQGPHRRHVGGTRGDARAARNVGLKPSDVDAMTDAERIECVD